MEYLRIERIPAYRPDAGGYEGRVSFKSGTGDVTLNLSPALSQTLLKIIGNDLVEHSRTLAAALSTEVLEPQPPALGATVGVEARRA